MKTTLLLSIKIRLVAMCKNKEVINLRNYVISLLILVFVLYLSNHVHTKTNDDQKYRYTLKVKFKKVKTGEDMQLIYYPLPRSNDYQIVSNFDTHGGQIFDPSYMPYECDEEITLKAIEN